MTEKSKAKPEDNDLRYSDAIAELEQILEDIEGGEIELDDLTDKVKRALLLVKVCKSKLRSTDEEIKKVLEEFRSLDTEN